jgi:crossover junction endodeoxyribonuclease RusA
MSLRFTLPWPPSVNTYWRHIVLGGKFKKAQARVLLSEQGRRYQIDAFTALNQQRVPKGALKGRLAVSITAYPPDRRARDLDNLLKGTLDALKHSGTISDDGDIDILQVRRGPVRAGGMLDMAVAEITPADLTHIVDMFHHREVCSAKMLEEAQRALSAVQCEARPEPLELAFAAQPARGIINDALRRIADVKPPF